MRTLKSKPELPYPMNVSITSPDACLSCGNQHFEKWGSQNGFDIIMCKCCQMGYTWPLPTEEQLRGTNVDTYTIENRLAAYRSNKSHFEQRYRNDLRRISKFTGTGRLLDIGCNLGLFVKAAVNAGYRAEGIELNAACAEYARNTTGIIVFEGLLEKANFPTHSFDIVTLFDVLEHVRNPMVLLQEIRRILRPNGILVLQMPNIRSFMATLMRNQWPWLCPPDHVFHFSPQSLRNILLKSGFRLEIQVTWEPPSDFAGAIVAVLSENCRFFARVERRIGIVRLLTTILQRAWWLLGYGGLVLTFAKPARDSRPPNETAKTS